MKPSTLTIEAREESWPLEHPFRTSRGASTATRVVVATVSDGRFTGRGEAAPISRYQQTPESVIAQIESVKNLPSFDRLELQTLLPPGAARNALDCALWDLEAKTAGKRAWELANVGMRREVETVFTISLDAPAAMAAAASAHAHLPLLKLKLGGDAADLPRVELVRKEAPAARLLIDANESWTPEHYRNIVGPLKDLGVELIEQPFPAAADEALESLERTVPVCADESCHTSEDVPRLASRYDMVNIKLDKTGGLTEALVLAQRARQSDLQLLVGCMVCTSLGIAPARVIASLTDFADLDGPLLLAKDREHGIPFENGRVGLPSVELWG